MTTADLLHDFALDRSGCRRGARHAGNRRPPQSRDDVRDLPCCRSSSRSSGFDSRLLGNGEPVAGLIRLDGYAVFFIGLLLAAGMAVTLMSHGYMNRYSVLPEESYVLILIAVLGCAVLVSSVHFASFFIGLELLTVSLYILIAYCRSQTEGHRGRHQVLHPGGHVERVSSVRNGLDLRTDGNDVIARTGPAGRRRRTGPPGWLVLLGTGMILTAIGFKLALAPFHLWAADVYEGSPDPVTALIATASKGAVFALLFRYFGVAA